MSRTEAYPVFRHLSLQTTTNDVKSKQWVMRAYLPVPCQNEFQAMSEPPLLPYLSRTLVCVKCRKTFTPSPEEAESLAELERTFGLQPDLMSAVCEDCGGQAVH